MDFLHPFTPSLYVRFNLSWRETARVGMENVRKDETSILEKYGMISCPRCNGLGKFFNGRKRFDVCETCGGFGAIKTPKQKVIGTTPKSSLSPGGRGLG